MRLTLASSTPGCRASVRWTRAWHAAQVIPDTGMSMRSEVSASLAALGATRVAMSISLSQSSAPRSALGLSGIPGVLDGQDDLLGRYFSRLVADLRRADAHVVDADAGKLAERFRDGGDAVAARHAFDFQLQGVHYAASDSLSRCKPKYPPPLCQRARHAQPS